MSQSVFPRLYTLADVARAAEVDYSTVYVKARYSLTLPGPDVLHGRRQYYSEERFQQVVAECKARKKGRSNEK